VLFGAAAVFDADDVRAITFRVSSTFHGAVGMRVRRWILTLGMTFGLAGGSLLLMSGCGGSKDAAGLAPPPDQAKVDAEQKAAHDAYKNMPKQ